MIIINLRDIIGLCVLALFIFFGLVLFCIGTYLLELQAKERTKKMSKLEELFPPLELCKLIPKGEFEDSAFMWFSNYHFGGWQIERHGLAAALSDNKELYPAPTLEELIKKLPLDIVFGKEQHGDMWIAQNHKDLFQESSGATAALKLWLKLKEIKYEKGV